MIFTKLIFKLQREVELTLQLQSTNYLQQILLAYFFRKNQSFCKKGINQKFLACCNLVNRKNFSVQTQILKLAWSECNKVEVIV